MHYETTEKQQKNSHTPFALAITLSSAFYWVLLHPPLAPSCFRHSWYDLILEHRARQVLNKA